MRQQLTRLPKDHHLRIFLFKRNCKLCRLKKLKKTVDQFQFEAQYNLQTCQCHRAINEQNDSSENNSNEDEEEQVENIYDNQEVNDFEDQNLIIEENKDFEENSNQRRNPINRNIIKKNRQNQQNLNNINQIHDSYVSKNEFNDFNNQVINRFESIEGRIKGIEETLQIVVKNTENLKKN